LEGGGGPPLVPNGLSSWLVNHCTWVWSLEPCWCCWITLCVFLCAVVLLFGAGSGGRTPPPPGTVGVYLYQMELSSWLVHLFHLGLESLEPCWCLLDHLCGFCAVVLFGAGSGGRTHSTTWNLVLEGVGGPSLVPNGTSSWLVNHFTWVWSPWNHVGACWITLCGFLCSGVTWGWITRLRTLHHQLNGLGRWWSYFLPNGTILMDFVPPFPLGSGVPGTILVAVGALCDVSAVVFFWGWIWW
jgi:hypothetical protein